MFAWFTHLILIAIPKCLLLDFPFLRLFPCSVHVKSAIPLSTHTDLLHTFLACFKSLLPCYQKYLEILLCIYICIYTHTYYTYIYIHIHKYTTCEETGSCHSSISFIYEICHYAIFSFEIMTNFFL